MSDLAKRAVACQNWKWKRGMAAVTASGAHFLRGTDTWEWDDHGALPGGPPQSEIAALLAGEILPDLDDPATLGCLLALVREAWGDPSVSCTMTFGGGWRVLVMLQDRLVRHFYGPTEAAALVAALEVAT